MNVTRRRFHVRLALASLALSGLMLGGCMADVDAAALDEGQPQVPYRPFDVTPDDTVAELERLPEIYQPGVPRSPEIVCAESQTLCGSRCVDLASDPSHCGTCEQQCGVGLACNAGTCESITLEPSDPQPEPTLTCNGGTSLCGDACIDLESNADHCGTCGNACAFGSCHEGSCEAPVQIATGDSHSCALMSSGDVYCWGDNRFGQRGRDDDEENGPALVPSVNQVVQISSGPNHTCALRDAGDVVCWGSGKAGELGGEILTDRNHAEQVKIDGHVLTGISEITAGYHRTCAITDSGEILCWGSGHENVAPTQLGPYEVKSSTTSIQNIIQIAIGKSQACALDSDGNVYCWTKNDAQPLMTADELTGTQITAITAGSAHFCTALANGEAWCWGQNSSGQLGDGTTQASDTPVRVMDSAGPLTDVLDIDAGANHTCVLHRHGGVSCWGQNDRGQVNYDAADLTWLSMPVAPSSTALRRTTQLAVGSQHVCIMTEFGEVMCWGDGSSGQLGDGSRNERSRPVAVEWTH